MILHGGPQKEPSLAKEYGVLFFFFIPVSTMHDFMVSLIGPIALLLWIILAQTMTPFTGDGSDKSTFLIGRAPYLVLINKLIILKYGKI